MYFDPTVLVGVERGMRILEEETFGPVAPIVGFTDEAEAIRAANATPYGLAAYIWTRDLGRAFRVAEALDYGIVGVNDGLAGDAACAVWRREEFRHRPRRRPMGARGVSRREIHLDGAAVNRNYSVSSKSSFDRGIELPAMAIAIRDLRAALQFFIVVVLDAERAADSSTTS